MSSVRCSFVAISTAAGALVVLAAVPWIGLHGTTVEAADPPALRVIGDARYVVDPDDARVRVRVTLAIANTRGETKTRRYWYDRTYLALQPAATAIHVSGAGLDPSVRVVRTERDHRLIEVQFGRRLYSGDRLTLNLRYELRDPGGAPNRPIRVGEGLVAFPVWALATDSTSGARASVELPAGFEVQYGGHAFSQGQSRDGVIELTSGALSDATKLRAYVVATGATAFGEQIVAIPVVGGELEVSIRGWSDDIDWRRRMAALVTEAAGVIATDTGLPGPHAGLVVEETTSWALDGGAIVLDPSVGRLLVAHDAPAEAVVRGLAQAFLAADVLAERWAIEGLAELYAERAAATAGIDLRAIAWSEELIAVGGPLNAWLGPSSEPTEVDAAARANAAELARRLVARVGDAGARRALRRLAGGISAYQPATVPANGPEKADGPADWRRIIDSFEAEMAASSEEDALSADLRDLWTTFVVRPEEKATLDERIDVRARYEATMAASAGWALPAAIREAMTNWQFDAASVLLDEIDVAMARRESLEVQAADLGLRLPAEIQPLFEGGRLVAALDEADAEAATLGAIARATEASTPAGPVAALGLVGEDPAGDLARAKAAFEAGRLDEAISAADAAQATWLTAEDEGSARLAVIGLIVGAVGLGVVVAARSRRPRARSPVVRSIERKAIQPRRLDPRRIALHRVAPRRTDPPR